MPAITNKDIMHKLDDHSDKLATVIERLKIVDDHEKTLYGDDKRGGLTADVNSAKTLSRAAIGVVSVASLILGIMQSLTGCSPVASPPQQTASALNATYEAAATPPAKTTDISVISTDTPAPTDTPTPTATISIIEVTPLGGEATPAIIVSGDINEPPLSNIWYWANGTYYSYEAWNVRECPDLTCKAVGSLGAGQTVDTAGALMDNAGSLWLCRAGKPGRDYGEDSHGAQWCYFTFLAWDAVQYWHGVYEVEN